jgi:hypothetical protein
MLSGLTACGAKGRPPHLGWELQCRSWPVTLNCSSNLQVLSSSVLKFRQSRVREELLGVLVALEVPAGLFDEPGHLGSPSRWEI